MPYTYNMGSRPIGEPFERLGRCGNCELQKFYRWSFLLSSMGNSLLLIGLTIAELTSYVNSNKDNSSLTFDIAILFIGLVAGWFAFHGIVFEYQYDIYLHLVSIAMAIIYCWIDYNYSGGDDVSAVRLIRSVITSSLLLPTLLFSLCVTCSEYWTEFYIIGASEEILNMYKKLRCFLSLLKFDFQTIVVMGIFTLTQGLQSKLDIIPVATISVYALSFWILVSYGVQNESSLPLFIFVFGSIAPPIWVTYKFVSYNCLVISCSRFAAGLNYAGFGAGVFAVIVRMFILIELMKVFRNFGYGLSDRAFSYLISPESTSLLGRPRRGSL